MRGWRPGDGHDRGAGLLRPRFRLAAGLGVAGLAAACGSDDGGTGVGVRRLQDAALLAEGTPTRCPLDLGFPNAVGGDVQPTEGDRAAAGTSVGKAKAGSSLLAAGGASYRCSYQVNGQPVQLVVVAVPEGKQPADAAAALTGPLEDAGLDPGGTRALVDAARGAKPGTGVPAPTGTAAAASAALPGGGAAAVGIVAVQGGPTSKDLAEAADKVAAELSG